LASACPHAKYYVSLDYSSTKCALRRVIYGTFLP
jgi:hypothetical protein